MMESALCVYECVFMWVLLRVQMWRLEIGVEPLLSSGTVSFLFWDRGSQWPGACWFGKTGWPGSSSPPISTFSVQDGSGSTYLAFYLYIFILTWILETGSGIELRSSRLHAKNLLTELSSGHQMATCKQHWESRVHLGEYSISSLSKYPQWSQKVNFPLLLFFFVLSHWFYLSSSFPDLKNGINNALIG